MKHKRPFWDVTRSGENDELTGSEKRKLFGSEWSDLLADNCQRPTLADHPGRH